MAQPVDALPHLRGLNSDRQATTTHLHLSLIPAFPFAFALGYSECVRPFLVAHLLLHADHLLCDALDKRVSDTAIPVDGAVIR